MADYGQAAPRLEELNLRVRPWRGLEELRHLVPEWKGLCSLARTEGPCNSPEWVLAHAEAYGGPRMPFGWYLSMEDGRPLGLFPLRTENKGSSLGRGRAIFCADGTFESDYLDIPIRPGFERPVLDAVLQLLAGCTEFDTVLLSCLAPGSKLHRLLPELLVERGIPWREDEVPCAAAALPSRFDDYLASLKPRMRSKVRSALRRAEEAGGSYHWCDEPGELERHLEGLMDLHTLRWQAAGSGGSFGEPQRRSFYRQLWPALHAQGRLRFARLEVEGRAVAYQIGARMGTTYYQVQEGYHPDFARMRAATALRAWAARALIEEGVESYDFMAGDSQHKRDWGAESRSCKSFVFAQPSLSSRIAFGTKELILRWRNGRRGVA